MQVVVTTVLTVIATSGWWYFAIHPWPEAGIMVLPAIITVFSTLGVMAILAFNIITAWSE